MGCGNPACRGCSPDTVCDWCDGPVKKYEKGEHPPIAYVFCSNKCFVYHMTKDKNLDPEGQRLIEKQVEDAARRAREGAKMKKTAICCHCEKVLDVSDSPHSPKGRFWCSNECFQAWDEEHPEEREGWVAMRIEDVPMLNAALADAARRAKEN